MIAPLRSMIGPARHWLPVLMLISTTVFADARTDGDKGIEEFSKGNLIEAMQLLEKAAKGGYAPAQVTLAYILDQSERDKEAFNWYQQAADLGDPAGIFGLGTMYAKGEGTDKDPEKAGQLIGQAAQLGHVQAMRAYAYALEHGNLGLSQDPSAAGEWFLKAAEAGDPVSMRRIREAYAQGQLGLPVDPDQAARWDALINPEN